jgi:hypothetical protein
MRELIINGTKKTLGISCVKGLIELNGCSITENPKPFFQPVFEWLEEYLKDASGSITINFKIEYIDSASLKHIYVLLKRIISKSSADCEVIVNWNIVNKDPEIIEIGKILENKLNFKFNYS